MRAAGRAHGRQQRGVAGGVGGPAGAWACRSSTRPADPATRAGRPPPSPVTRWSSSERPRGTCHGPAAWTRRTRTCAACRMRTLDPDYEELAPPCSPPAGRSWGCGPSQRVHFGASWAPGPAPSCARLVEKEDVEKSPAAAATTRSTCAAMPSPATPEPAAPWLRRPRHTEVERPSGHREGETPRPHSATGSTSRPSRAPARSPRSGVSTIATRDNRFAIEEELVWMT